MNKTEAIRQLEDRFNIRIERSLNGSDRIVYRYYDTNLEIYSEYFKSLEEFILSIFNLHIDR